MPAKRLKTEEPPIPEVVLLTASSGVIPAPLISAIVERDDGTTVMAMHDAELSDSLHDLRNRHGDRLRLLKGQADAMDLGLSGSDVRWLIENVTTIHHVYPSRHSAANGALSEEEIVSAATNIIEVAKEAKRLRRLVHWSTTSVAGKRKGVVLEEELDIGQSFHSHEERGFLRAEKVMRAAMTELPIAVLRTSCVVGDSKTGAMNHFEGAGRLIRTIVDSRHQFPIPLPSGGRAPLHVVPVDYATRAAIAISYDEIAAGRTFHLTDPCPLPARFAFELVADHANTKVAKHALPSGLARTLLRAPGMERLSRTSRSLLDAFDQLVFFNCRGALDLLERHHISCPRFDHYIGKICAYLERNKDTSQHSPPDETIDLFE